MSRIKGGAIAARQNFSMHPALIKVFIETANHLNSERAELIITDRSKRVTYSKVAAAVAFYIKESLLGPNNGLTDTMRRIITDYEASAYESTDPPAAEVVPRKPQRARRAKATEENAEVSTPRISATDFSGENLEDDDEF